MSAITPGLQLGRYVIRTKLGAGGMAEVYLADDRQLGRRVALKFLPPETEDDTVAQRRLLREARAAATLDHPHICSVYEVGEADGRQFIAMQYVEGEALDARLRRSPLHLHETLAIAVQVVDALTEAHAHGILHRDIKPANIMVTTRGEAKVMDFGLARVAFSDEVTAGGKTVSLLSARGDIIGTAPYMSPEQACGEPLDPRSDLFSVGVVLYEMVSGQRPFQGASSAAVVAAILTHEPLPLARFAHNTPPELERIVSKALKKDADNRYQTAKDLRIDLRALKEEQDFQLKLGRMPASSGIEADRVTSATSAPSGQVAQTSSAASVSVPVVRSWRAAAIAAAVTVLAAVGWFAWQASNMRWARTQLAQITALAEANQYFEAFDLALQVEPYLPGDSTLAGLMPVISDSVSVTTTPPGATVYLRRFTNDAATAPSRQLVGTTPFTNARIARGQYILSVEKEGFAPIERTISGVAARRGTFTLLPSAIRIDQPLLPAKAQPARMVFVAGGDYRLSSWSRPTDRRVRLTDYFIDKYEVSNREYKEFISAGGYLKRDLWKPSFVKDGRSVSWDDAMKVLVDRTGLPGPRSWSNQSFPDGKADHPAADVTWYEAAAYARFRGKRLPTVFQWEKAARNGVIGPAGIAIMPWGLFYPGETLSRRANFGMGTLPVSSSEFGMSVFGAYNMAGNVAEWTLNDSSVGFLATGGAWGDPTYTFGAFGGRPGFYSSEKLGFRCAQNATDNADDQGGERIEIAQEIPVHAPSSPQVFATLASAYRYQKAPLDARVEETKDMPDWKREKITFNGANGARAIAYLYLPNHVARPLQVLHFLPAADVAAGLRSLPDTMDDLIAPYVRAGRAAFGVVLEGYVERLSPTRVAPPSAATVEFADMIVNRITDLRRGLDYLETRTDLDLTRIAALAPSAGSTLGLIVGALETRYRALVFVGTGIRPSYRDLVAPANPINFAPHIRVPKLLVQGRYDEDTPVRTAAEPLFKLLIEPKRIVFYEGGHVPSIEVMMSATSGWLDETLGRVTR
jgi:eukaryotic-like serine/threonine-protein kinase